MDEKRNREKGGGGEGVEHRKTARKIFLKYVKLTYTYSKINKYKKD